MSGGEKQNESPNKVMFVDKESQGNKAKTLVVEKRSFGALIVNFCCVRC